MTRINCVDVSELSTKHLVAEWRELPRVFKLADKAYKSGKSQHIPQKYTLGTGHVKFFYQRLGYLLRRFAELRYEMLARGYKPTYEKAPDFEAPQTWLADWHPDAEAIAINRQRIAERTK
jgi:deoxyribonuclease (pyrimidine dimer)